MKCRKQPLWAKTEIKNVWEVRMDLSTWKNIQSTAKIHSKSYSWIVRYCVFQLAHRKNLRWKARMENLHNKIKKNTAKNIHRHQLCLYGDDEILLRNSAILLGITVSQLIRISIAMFLDRVLKSKVSKKNFFYRGIKVFSEIKSFRSIKNNLITMYFHSLKPFKPEDYWGFT